MFAGYYLEAVLYCVFTSFHLVYGGSFSGNPGTVTIHENDDAARTLWTISATCDVTYTCYTSCAYQSCWFSVFGVEIGCSTKYRSCATTCSTTVACDSCEFTSSPPADLFQMDGMTAKRLSCSSPGCGPTCSQNGCVNAGESWSIVVACWKSSGYLTNGRHSDSFTVTISQNAAPDFTFSAGSSIDVYKATAGSNTVVNTMQATDSDSWVDSGTIFYRLASGPGPSFIHGNTLFDLRTTNGQIYVTQSLDLEFSYTFSMSLCVYDRRQDENCHTLSITLHACFQTPNCTSQSDFNVWDTHGLVTGHGTTNTLFNMIYPATPSEHFPAFSSSWHQLQWTFASNELSSATIDYTTGEIYLTTNISIHPSYPSKDFTQVVNVANSESCYTTTCTMSIRVWYKNWDPEIRSLPATVYIHEDTDAETLLHSLILFDYNYADEDNFTCTLDSVSPTESNLFVLRHVDGLYNYNSYGFYKLICQQAGCGYKYGTHSGMPYLCQQDLGCLNYDLRSSYVLSITCTDAYGASDTGQLTVQIVENRLPTWINLPTTIEVNTDLIGALDTIFSITYWDLEGEDLIYEYTFQPMDYGYFATSATGNYYNNLANITMTVYLWDKVNQSLSIDINAHERRNEIDSTLTILFREYCGETPTCNDYQSTLTAEFAVGTEVVSVASLLNAPANGIAFTGVSYSIVSNPSGYFTVDSSTGSITSTSSLVASQPSSTYSISAFVFATNVCAYAVCSITLTVTPVNYAISITNLPATVSIHEDTTAITTLFLITTSDNNAEDNANCSITTISPGGNAFYLDETLPGSYAYIVKNIANPGFTSATVQYTVSILCHDGRGSSDTGDLTVDIELNQSPTFSNLASPTSVNIDPATQYSGATVYTVSGTDTESDDLTYTCTVANTYVPFVCVQGTNVMYVNLRRNVSILTENNAIYSVTVTISDAKHTAAATGTLTATFTSSWTHPEISNLPGTAIISEDAAIGTSVFDVDLTDPDVGDVHSFSLVSVSPGSGSSMFSLDQSTGVVTTRATFDYETTTSYVLTLTVQDTNLAALASKELTVTVSNVNEAPNLSVTDMSLTFAEDLAVGGDIEDPGFNCTDVDASDTLTFSITSGTHAAYFSINSNTGLLSLAQVWDLDSSGLPMATYLVVTCSDAAGLTATSGIDIVVTYVNEFTPVATGTIPGGATSITISAETTVIEDLMSVGVTDADAGGTTVFSYDIIGNGRGSTYFTMYTATANSATAYLRINSTITLYYDTNMTFSIKVSDGSLYTGVAVDVFYNSSLTPTVIGPESKCVTCTSNGRALIAVLCIEAAIIIGILAHICFHCYRIRENVKTLKFKTKTREKVSRTRFKTPGGLGNRSGPVIAPPLNQIQGRKTNTSTARVRPRRSTAVSPGEPSIHEREENISSSSCIDSDSDDSVDSLRARRSTDIPRTAFNHRYSSDTGLPTPLYTNHVKPTPHVPTRLPPPVYSNFSAFNQGSNNTPPGVLLS